MRKPVRNFEERRYSTLISNDSKSQRKEIRRFRALNIMQIRCLRARFRKEIPRFDELLRKSQNEMPNTNSYRPSLRRRRSLPQISHYVKTNR